MVSRGLVIDPEETAKKGIAPEIADERALNHWKDRPIEQQLVELRMLREDLVSKLDFVRAEIDETLAAGFQREIDDFTAQIKRLEKISRRRSAQMTKSEKKTTVARDRLVAHLREAAEKIPEEGDSPVIELGRKARRAVAQHDRLEAETADQALARLTDREKVQTSYEWINNLMMNDYAVADRMGISRETVAEFYRKTHALDAVKTINRIVQDHRFFFRIKAGLWALNSRKDAVLKGFQIEKPKKENQEAFDHTYFQGLLVEVGNLRGFQTFVPNQDKRKRFLSRALGEVSTLEKICEFSYEKLVKRARTIDVIWFNERNMPASCFEVEHSTDIYNSLIKFSDLTDFHSNFCIVANYARKREYDQKLSSNIFAKIRERINFMSYEQLSDLHANTFKLRKTTETIAFLGN